MRRNFLPFFLLALFGFCVTALIGSRTHCVSAQEVDRATSSKAPSDSAAQSKSILWVTSFLTSTSKLRSVENLLTELHVEMRAIDIADLAESDLDRLRAEPPSLLVIDAAHSSVATKIASTIEPLLEGTELPYVLIGDFDSTVGKKVPTGWPLATERGVDSTLAQRIREYYRFGNNTNIRNLAKTLATGTVDDASPPVPFPTQGFYHPSWEMVLSDPSQADPLLLKLSQTFKGGSDPDQVHGTVAIAINAATLTFGDTQWLDRLITQFEQNHIAAFAFFGQRQNPRLFEEMLRGPDGLRADLVLNSALVFRPNERKADLEALQIPVMQLLPSLAMTGEQWRANPQGLSFNDISYYCAASEQAGMIDPILLIARNRETQQLSIIDEQVPLVVERAIAHLRLQKTKRADRKLAIVVYNYPSGADNFGASFLNVPQSASNILNRLAQEGYQCQATDAETIVHRIQRALQGFYSRDELQELVADGLADRLNLSDYLNWFRNLPSDTQARIESYWGPPESSTMLITEANGASFFAIPRLSLGHVAILPQPLRFEVQRGVDTATRKTRLAHRSAVPLSHHYLATYLWMRSQWQAHAMIHLGTHGTAEWAPGKERGLSAFDDPYLALGNLPNLYPYIMDNLGEALTAKRRGRATLLSHLTPMFTPSGFRPGWHEMHDLMHDWETADEGTVRDTIQAKLEKTFIEQNLHRDLGFTEEEVRSNFAQFQEVLHPYLDDIAQSAQPQGLAVFGNVPEPDRRFGMIMQILRRPLIDALGEDIDEVFLLDSEKVMRSRPARWLRIALADPETASTLDLRKLDEIEKNQLSTAPNRAAEKKLDPAVLRGLALRAIELDQILSKNEELDRLIDALDGQHVPSSYGGDPVRNPESLPTGRNLFGFDPNRIPTKQAWEIGVEVQDRWMEEYQKANDNRLPRKIAFSLWAGETIRHQGVVESQILYAMGIRPVWGDAGRVTGLEVIPASELRAPRQDVVLSVTGSYRDQFPSIMNWIDQAVVLAAQQDEENNGVAKGSSAIREQLTRQGVDPDIAKKLSLLRIFSNESGTYGNGLSDRIEATDLFDSERNENESEMANQFVDRMGYIASPISLSESESEIAHRNLLAMQLETVDAAVLSRSSHTYGVLTSDDAYQYLGGLSLAIRNATGRSPTLYVENLRDQQEVILDRASVSIAKEMNSRYLHPQWIRAQMQEGYSGTLQVLKAVQFLWGWQVTDPDTVRPDQWQSIHSVYLRDQYNLGTREWFEKENAGALSQLAERMLEAIRLGYWTPDDKTRNEIIAAYRAATLVAERLDRNTALDSFLNVDRKTPETNLVQTQPDKPDPTALSTENPSPEQVQSERQVERVQGIRMEEIAATPPISNSVPGTWPFLAAGLLMLFLWGAWMQWRR